MQDNTLSPKHLLMESNPHTNAVTVGPILPKHIAFIMDGNGRWAQQRGLPRTAGHEAGMRTVRKVVEACAQMSVRVVTLYAFSTENWQRPIQEVGFLMRLFQHYVGREIETLNRNNIQLRFIGRRQGLPADVLSAMKKGEEHTSQNDGVTLNIAINYGGRSEIVDAARNIIRAVRAGEIDAGDVSEATIGKFLYTTGQPDPELIIRTAGEKRLSNFLLWQSAYTLFWSTETKWPDFDTAELEQAIRDWQRETSEPTTL
jgi:undecaprenyl diphosphate synthase